MQQSPIMILDTSEGSSSLRIEYKNETDIHSEINGEAASHIFHVMMLTEYLLRELSSNEDLPEGPLSDEEISAISIASTLHDIGKKQIPKSILESKNILSPLEYDIIKKHSLLGESMIREAAFENIDPKLVEYAAQIARGHHERIDGRGYPDGLRGDEIPLCAQVVAIADAYDALTSVRSYKQALTQDVALQMIASGNCGAFDEKLVTCLGRVIKHNAIVSFSKELKERLSIVSDYEEIQLKRVLLVGNTAYLDKSFLTRTFPQSKVTVAGNSTPGLVKNPLSSHNNVASVEVLLKAYEYDLIVFFAEGLSFHSKQKSDTEELRRLLKYSSTLQKSAKILYLSPLDAAFESNTDRAIASSANEKLCEFYADKHGLCVKVIRIPYLYSSTYKNDFLYNLFDQLYAHKMLTIPESPLSKMHFLSITDLSDLMVRIVDNWRGGYGILSVDDEFELSFADLAKKITELDETAKIDFVDSDCSGILKFNNTNLRDEHGWYAKLSLIDELQEQYARFVETKEKKSIFTRVKEWLEKHSALIKTVELFGMFALSEFLVRITNSSVLFSIVDFRTIFIVIMATMYGTTLGISAAALASISYFISRVEAGTNALTLFYEPSNWIAFILFFLVGGLCGYINLKNKDHCKTVEEQSALLQDKLSFTVDLYEETLLDKKALKKQIVSSKDSFGRILNIAKSLNSVKPQHLYLKIVEAFEESLENKSIAVYMINPRTPFGRLQVASRDILDTVSRSILLGNYAPVMDAIKDGGIWKNTDLNIDYPAYASGVYRGNDLIMVIFLWHANSDQRSLYYANLFTILCDLAQMSLLRAYDYSIAMYEKQYIPNTRIMNSKYFGECIENYKALNAKKISSYVLLELNVGNLTLEEADTLIRNKVRTTDIIGITSAGKIQIILTQATSDDLQYILPRFEGTDIQIKILT